MALSGNYWMQTLLKLLKPRNDDVQNVHDIQILQVDVKGEWNFSKWAPTFAVGNKEEIDQIFQNYLL